MEEKYRMMAVHAVRDLGLSPELIAKAYHFDRTCIYRWLKHYDDGGHDALESKMAPGAEPLVNEEMEDWLKQTVLSSTPANFGYDTNLWTSAILADLLNQEFDVTVSESTVRLHLKALGLSCQKPEYQDIKKG